MKGASTSNIRNTFLFSAVLLCDQMASRWLLHEAFCRQRLQKPRYLPIGKNAVRPVIVVVQACHIMRGQSSGHTLGFMSPFVSLILKKEREEISLRLEISATAVLFGAPCFPGLFPPFSVLQSQTLPSFSAAAEMQLKSPKKERKKERKRHNSIQKNRRLEFIFHLEDNSVAIFPFSAHNCGFKLQLVARKKKKKKKLGKNLSSKPFHPRSSR